MLRCTERKHWYSLALTDIRDLNVPYTLCQMEAHRLQYPKSSLCPMTSSNNSRSLLLNVSRIQCLFIQRKGHLINVVIILEALEQSLEDVIIPEMTIPEISFILYTFFHFLFYLPPKGKGTDFKYLKEKKKHPQEAL